MAEKKYIPRDPITDERIEYERNQTLALRNDMIQKGRQPLTAREFKCVCYAISKIKPDDKVFQEYTFDIKDFYDVCGLESSTYTEFKAMMIGLKSKCWWATIDDKGTEAAVSWFNKVHTNKKSGKVTIRFDDDMMPYLLDLVNSGEFYTSVTLKYILPMASQYAPKLYELLKSYSNLDTWCFEIDELRKKLSAENYKRWPDFRRFALEPAVEDINRFSDIDVIYKPVRAESRGRPVTHIRVWFLEKKLTARLEAEREGAIVLDGQIDFEDYARQLREESADVRAFREAHR